MTTENGVLLRLEDVAVHFGGIHALDGVSLHVDQGQIVALMGPNGAGKSTVLKAIFGINPLVRGTVYWRGQPLHAATHEMVHLGIAFVPQGRRIFTHLSIEENLEMGCLYLRDKAEKRRRMDEVMDIFPVLYEKREAVSSQMSGGEQQMLALGRGLMANPDILMLDEPTLGLAPKVVGEILAKVAEINQRRGLTILLVEHNIRSVLNVASHVYVLDKGLLAYEGTPEKVLNSDILTQVFLGKVEVAVEAGGFIDD
jgi:branched-chain amino acid transport system ATP-binding protein